MTKNNQKSKFNFVRVLTKKADKTFKICMFDCRFHETGKEEPYIKIVVTGRNAKFTYMPNAMFQEFNGGISAKKVSQYEDPLELSYKVKSGGRHLQGAVGKSKRTISFNEELPPLENVKEPILICRVYVASLPDSFLFRKEESESDFLIPEGINTPYALLLYAYNKSDGDPLFEDSKPENHFRFEHESFPNIGFCILIREHKETVTTGVLLFLG